MTWRATSTLNLSAWWLSVPLLLLEVHAVFGLGLFTFSLWDVDSVPPVAPRREAPGRIAVLIPTYNEPIDVLLPAVAAAAVLEPAHETWVLDDGNRPAVRRLAAQLGVRYLARTDRAGAKAGNVNHALSVIEADFVAILDADHVAGRDFLVNTLGYFDDPKIAFVQTPQDFYNTDSFEHERRRRWWRGGEAGQHAFSEQALFYRVLQPGKNRWHAAFWCGTGAVVRVEALRQVGGVATETVTEDILADSLTFVGFFSATFLLQRLALARLARGRAPHLLSTVFEFVRMSANIGATLTLFGRRAGGFAVTPKGRVGDDRRRQPVPVMLYLTTGLSVLAATWFALTLAGWSPLHYGQKWVVYGAFGWLVVNGALVVVAMARIRSERFAGERRASVRFEADAPGSLDGRPCRVRDLSLTGAKVVLSGMRPDPMVPAGKRTLTADLGVPVTLRAEVRSSYASAEGTILGLEFCADQDAERASLALALFHSDADPERVPVTDGAADSTVAA